MRPVVLYVTASLDGYIAEPGGGMGWLDSANASGTDFGFADFYAGIDAMLMGSHTYEFLLDLGGPFPHADRDVYVFTARELPSAAPSVTIVHEAAETFVPRLKSEAGGPIWLVGGGQLDRALWDAGLIDQVRLFVQPVVLGDGVPLLPAPHARRTIELTGSVSWPAGVIELRYDVDNGD